MYAWQYQEAILASKLTANAKLVALAISYHYNWKQARQSFPSISKLTDRTSLSRASIYRAKNELISNGYLISTRRFNDSNLYLPVIPPQSHTDTLGVSEGRTNYEYNYEVNYEEKAANAALVINNNIDQEEYWRTFDEEERYRRRHPAGRGNQVAGRGNKKPRRNNQDSTGIAGISEEFISTQAEYRMG